MTSRTRFLITAAFLCHLLVAPRLVTSQLLSPQAAQVLPNTPATLQQQQITITALQQERQGPLYMLRGKAQIHYGTYILSADEITYNSDTSDATAEGHVVLDGGPNDEHIEANHGTYNIKSESGRFEYVRGSIGALPRGNRLILTSSSPFFFSGKAVEKIGADHYKVYDGTVTNCELPHPRWEFGAHKVVVEVGGTAKIYHSTFGIKGIPILYFPFATLPAERLPRQSGFLIPNIGTSSIKGFILGESFFWAINRSMDAHIGVEYFSKRGWAPQGEFRARPSEKSFVDLNYFQVIDRGLEGVNQGGEEVRLTAEDEFGHNFRGVADIDYLSSFVFRLAFNEVFTQAVNSEVKSEAFLSNTTGGYFYNGLMQRYQDFESTTPGQVITILHAPGAEIGSVDHQIGNSPFYWSYDAALEGLSRSEPGFSTAPLLGRLDVNPDLSVPLRIGQWSLRPEFSARDTTYTQELQVSGGVRSTISDTITRKSLEGSVELRPPALDRVFDREFLGRKWKHVIEPRVAYNYVRGVNNFANILRFDARDILTNTNEVEYAVVNRLYAKRRNQTEKCGEPGMPTLFVGGPVPHNPVPWIRQSQPTETPCNAGPETREIVRWELAQKYFIDPTFGGALSSGQTSLFTNTSTIDLTGIGFLVQPRHLSPLISRLRIQTSSNTDVEWDLDYDFKQTQCVTSSSSGCGSLRNAAAINASTAFLNYHFGLFTFGAGDALLRVPPEAGFLMPIPESQSFNQFRLLLGYGHTNKPGFSAATNIGFDANLNFLQYAAVQTTYNWDCCGINLEFRRFALGSVRNENQYRFTFALANLGALGNLRRPERLF
ncbi:MAG TPA: LPS assembly protein LptD [Terriglobales bacterium]|nr:LPS assembly protein LptD [Terriglobales bacterium]